MVKKKIYATTDRIFLILLPPYTYMKKKSFIAVLHVSDHVNTESGVKKKIRLNPFFSCIEIFFYHIYIYISR